MQKALPTLSLPVAIYAPAQRLLEVREVPDEQPLQKQQSRCTLEVDADVPEAHQIHH